jgi:ABC-type dipeptide/oligopeptide/nickel transport systems, permease components
LPKRSTYFARKALIFAAEVFVAITLNFVIARLMPGNPVNALIARYIGKGRYNPALVNAIKDLYGLSNQPLYVQYWHYLVNTFHGNLGISFTYFPTPVGQLIAQALPYDIVLLGLSTILSFAIGSLLGIVLALRRGGVADTLITNVFNFLGNFPYFFVAILLLYLLGFTFKLFPTGGIYSPTVEPGLTLRFVSSYLDHLFLPALTIVLTSVGGWILLTRNVGIINLFEDYAALGEIAGISRWRYALYYIGKNSILPSFTSFGISLGFIVSGAVVTEEIFDYPGTGYLLVQAVGNYDYPLMQGIFLVIVLAVLVANFIMDIVYGFIDPRVGAYE